MTELLVVLSKLTLSLENVDSDSSLVVCSSREGLTLFGWDGSVSCNEFGANSSHSLDTKGKRGHIKKEDIFNITREDSSLNSCTDGYGLIWVYSSVGLLSKEMLDSLTNLWHSGRATNKKNFINFVFGETRVLKTAFKRLNTSADKVID